MNRYIVLCLALVVTAIALVSCGQSDTSYAEQKKRESKAIDSFVKREVVLVHEGDTLLYIGKINPIPYGYLHADCPQGYGYLYRP